MKNYKIINLFIFLVISVLIFVFGVAIYSTLDPDMPFQRWDMDYSTTLDSYYLGSNLMPNHLAHPGVGLNFLVSICQYFFFKFGFLSSLGFDDLAGSVNLFIPFAEKMFFLKTLSVFLIFFIVYFSSLSLSLLSNQNKYITFLLLFVAISTMNTLWIHTIHIRSEAYSIFFFSIVILTLVFLKKTNYKSKALLLICFVLAIFSIATKVQSTLVIVIFFALFYIFDNSQKFYAKNYIKNNNDFKNSFYKKFYYINLIIFSLFFLLSLFYDMEVSLKDGAFRGNYNKPFESLFFIFFLMINFLIIFSIQRKINPFIDNLFGSLILLIFALNIFFFLHLVLPMGIYKNYEYLLLNFKLLFLSEVNIEATMNVLSSLNPRLLLKSMPAIYENFLWNISKHYFQYFSLFCLFILIYFNYLKNNIKIQKFTKYVLIISFFLLIIHILKFTRAGAWNHRDGIYNEYIIFMFIVLSIYLSLNFCKKKIFHLIFLYSYLLLTSLLSILNLNYLNQKDSNQNYSFYQNLKKPVGGENISRFMEDDKIDPYSSKRNVNITKTALNFYDTKEERLQHFKQASNYNKIKIILKNSHDNYINNVDLKSVGIIEKSSKLKLHDRKIEIVKFTNELENNFIVNFKNLKNEKYYFANVKIGYKQIIFYDERKHNRENLPCYEKEEKSILTIKDNGVLIDLFSYTPIFQCNFLTKNFDKNLYYTFIRLY